MSNIAEIYDLWLKPQHLPKNSTIPVTVETVEIKTLHPRPGIEERKIILSFVGKRRKLILNAGNANRLADLGGEDWSAWPGLVVGLRRAQYSKDKETIIITPPPPAKTASSTPQPPAPDPQTATMATPLVVEEVELSPREAMDQFYALAGQAIIDKRVDHNFVNRLVNCGNYSTAYHELRQAVA